MTEAWTIRRIVTWTAQDFGARGMASPRLDAELIVAHALSVDRVALYMDLDRPLSKTERSVIRALVERRRQHEPVAYLLGRREFYGRSFAVSPAVLVPRPETETLVERALGFMGDAGQGAALDLCTGSGNVACTLAAELPSLTVHATDVSREALAMAQQNAQALGVASRVEFYEGDLFDAVPAHTYGLITANPPYIRDAEVGDLAADIREHEPSTALAGGADGLDVIRRLVAGALPRLAPGGGLIIEVGHQQAATVERLLAEAGFVETDVVADLAGIDRVVSGRKTE